MPSAVIASWSRRDRSISRTAVRVLQRRRDGGRTRTRGSARRAGGRKTQVDRRNRPHRPATVIHQRDDPASRSRQQGRGILRGSARRKHGQARAQKLERRSLRLQPGGPVEPEGAGNGEVARRETAARRDSARPWIRTAPRPRHTESRRSRCGRNTGRFRRRRIAPGRADRPLRGHRAAVRRTALSSSSSTRPCWIVQTNCPFGSPCRKRYSSDS